jgi:predicted ATPase
MLVSRVSVEQELVGDGERGRWPFTMPCVAAIAREGLELNCPVTFLVGENGSGKSTLVEAIAQAFGLDARRPGRPQVRK